MKSETLNDDLMVALTWALDRILSGEYKEGRDSAGNLDAMVLDRDFGPVNALRSSVPRHGAEPGNSRHGSGHARTHRALAGAQIASELRNTIPGFIRRAGTLQAVPGAEDFPEFVSRFLGEASRCLLYGQFLAALFLCRSALAEAVAATLRQRGFAEDLAQAGKEGLKGIFRLAHQKGILDVARHGQADEIRVLANQAIHGSKAPAEAECVKAFSATIGVVQSLSA